MLEAKKDRVQQFRLGGEVTRVFSREGEVEGGEAGAQAGATRPSTPLADQASHQAPHPDPCATDAGGRNTQATPRENGSSRLSSSAQGAERQGRPEWLTLRERDGMVFLQTCSCSCSCRSLGLYYLSGERYRNLLLLIASYVFYAGGGWTSSLLFAGVTVFNYWIGLRIGAAGVRTRAAQRWLILGVVVDLCVLGYFKYANFGVDSLNEIITVPGSRSC